MQRCRRGSREAFELFVNKYMKDAYFIALGKALFLEEAGKLGANAVVGLRFSTAEIMQHAAEILAYGTAVVVE
jgi:uncharacterized protein YbjQ (UPF0145 family)